MAAANAARQAPLRPLWQPQDGNPAVLVSEALATTQEAVVTHRFPFAVDILRKARDLILKCRRGSRKLLFSICLKQEVVS